MNMFHCISLLIKENEKYDKTTSMNFQKKRLPYQTIWSIINATELLFNHFNRNKQWNLSDKAISEAQWLTIYKENNQPFYVANLPALQFGKTVAPKANEVVTLSTDEEAVLSQIRPHLQQGKSIQVDIIGTSIHFADGSKIGLVSEQK